MKFAKYAVHFDQICSFLNLTKCIAETCSSVVLHINTNTVLLISSDTCTYRSAARKVNNSRCTVTDRPTDLRLTAICGTTAVDSRGNV